MPGGKGKSTGGKAGPKEAAAKSQKSHSAKAGLQVSITSPWASPCKETLDGRVSIVLGKSKRPHSKTSTKEKRVRSALCLSAARTIF